MHNNNTNSASNLIGKISEEVSIQLHSGIMKKARRTILNEIINSTILEFVALKKVQSTSNSSKAESINKSVNLSSPVKKVCLFELCS